MTTLRSHYNFFLESGDIYEMNENATGEWIKDRVWFKPLYESTLKGINNLEVYESED